MRDFKKYTSAHIRRMVKENSSKLLKNIRFEYRKQSYKVWMDRFDEVYIKNRKMLERVLDYIHENPLQKKWQIVENPWDYPYSSAAYYHSGKTGLIELRHYHEYFPF